MNSNTEPKKIDRHTHAVVGGIILILIGVGNLLAHWFVLDVGIYLPLLLGLGMLAWGAFSHSQGWIIPGGILSGIGIGMLVFSGPWKIASEYQPSVFLLCFALGWFLIPLFTRLFTSCMHWWPFIPG